MKRNILYNMAASLLLEVVSVVCAFILPRMIIVGFGSEYNGIVSSVTQFLSIITLLRGGVGGVTRAALYKPLAEQNYERISIVVHATERFMRKVSYIFLVFLVLFAVGYPFIVDKQFDWLFSFSLVLILGISTFAQYYFGITYQFLLQADQRTYIYSVLQTVATISNTILSVVLINAGIEFRLMKLISSVIFAAIPLTLYWYVHKNYEILRDTPKDDSVIKQRWDAFAHQGAAFVNNNTDLVLLTLFTDLYQVSIYSVYSMILNGINKFVRIFSSGVEAAIGNLIAKNEKEKLEESINFYEWGVNIVSVVAFTCTALLIIPFIQIYTRGITDANYIQPIFGYLLCLSFFFSCIRLPYQNVVEAAGHFKNTRNGAITEAAINLFVSLLLVDRFGCVGVAAGTTIAMLFRTVQYALYTSRYIVKRPYMCFVKRISISLLNITIIVVPYSFFSIDTTMKKYALDYFAWIIEGSITFIVVLIITLIINGIFYPRLYKQLITYLKQK